MKLKGDDVGKNYIEILYDKNRDCWHMAMFYDGKIFKDNDGYVPLMFFDEKNPELFWHNLRIFKQILNSIR